MKKEDRGHIIRYGSDEVMNLLAEKHGSRFVEYREMWDDAAKKHIVPDYPLYIALGINSDCNLRCKMCARAYDNSMNTKHQNISMELIDKIVKQCKDFHCPSVLIGQESECMLHPEFEEIVRRVKSIEPVDYFVISNGTLLNERISNLLIKEDIDRLQISIDASTSDTYKRIRGGNLDRLEFNINRFLELRECARQKTPILRVSFCKQLDNQGEEHSFLDKWSEKADIVDFQDYIDLSHVMDLKDMPYKEYFCPDPYQRLVIDFLGNIYACCCIGYNKYFKLGNLKSMTLLEAWHCDTIKDLRKSFATQNLKSACLNCRVNRAHE